MKSRSLASLGMTLIFNLGRRNVCAFPGEVVGFAGAEAAVVAICLAIALATGGGVGEVVVVAVLVIFAHMASVGAGHADDDALWFVGGGGLGGGLRVFFLAMHDREAVEEELGDVGHGGGLASGDAALGQLFQQVAEKEVDGSGCGETFRTGEEFCGGGLAALGLAGFSFGAGVEGAERGVIRR